MNLTCSIIDDEPHAIAVLTDYIRKTPGLSLSGTDTDPLRALEKAGSGQAADLTFLDIDMPELSGLELAGLIKAKTIIIFTTSYREYALEAFERDAADYLLKPISYARFYQCLLKVSGRFKEQQQAGDAPSCLFVKTGGKSKQVRVELDEIRYVSGSLNYIELHLENSRLLTYCSLQDFLSRLPQQRFSRIHQSYIINHRYLRVLEYGQVKLDGPVPLPLGRAYRASFLQKIGSSFLDQPAP